MSRGVATHGGPKFLFFTSCGDGSPTLIPSLGQPFGLLGARKYKGKPLLLLLLILLLSFLSFFLFSFFHSNLRARRRCGC